MKSEHRHELAENSLEKALTLGRERIEPYSKQILIGVLAVAVALVGYMIFSQSSRATRLEGWTKLAACETPDDYATVADQYKQTAVGGWARLRAAEGWLREGIDRAVTDRAASNDRLDEARKAFEAVLNEKNLPPEVREQALNGLALCLEASSDGDTEPAVKAYQQLIDEFPESRFRRWAEDRVTALQTQRVKDFYAWFHAQNPKPEDRPLPRDLMNPGGTSTDLPEAGTSTSATGLTPFTETSEPGPMLPMPGTATSSSTGTAPGTETAPGTGESEPAPATDSPAGPPRAMPELPAPTPAAGGAETGGERPPAPELRLRPSATPTTGAAPATPASE